MDEGEIKRMANTCENYHSCALCPYNPEDISRFIGDRWKGGCPNYDRKLVYSMGKGYRQIADDEIVIKGSEYLFLKKDYDEWKDEYDHNCLLRLEVFELEKQLAKAKQDTARDIISIIIDDDGADLNKIAQKYGIETEWIETYKKHKNELE